VSDDAPVIRGAHTVMFADDAEAARAFFRDVLQFPAVDAGGGWLIFALPPGELAVHPGPVGDCRLYLMCADLRATMAELERRGVEFTAPASTERWGLVTSLRVPGAGEVGLYQPTHASPLDGL
jgi:catechol 2,3-dioxygenase-like lactoylglutathione lyase family enzyme